MRFSLSGQNTARNIGNSRVNRPGAKRHVGRCHWWRIPPGETPGSSPDAPALVPWAAQHRTRHLSDTASTIMFYGKQGDIIHGHHRLAKAEHSKSESSAQSLRPTDSFWQIETRLLESLGSVG